MLELAKTGFYGKKGASWYVFCHECYGAGPSGETHEDAVSKWNAPLKENRENRFGRT